MPKLIKIGIVGCGAIGGSLAKIIAKDFSAGARVSALLDIDAQKAGNLSAMLCHKHKLAVRSLPALLKKSDFVIEAASASCSFQIAKDTVSCGKDIMVMSVGGVLDNFDKLKLLARKHKAKIYIPSGAIAGLDALKAACGAGIKKVTLTTRKNPLSFQGVKYVEDKGLNLEEIKEDTELFNGPAKEAVKYFPQNINVAAVLSLAGIGQDATVVRIMASPSTNKNIHEIAIESSAGNIVARTENVLHPDNPKTSYLAVLSAAATLRQILEPVRIGT